MSEVVTGDKIQGNALIRIVASPPIQCQISTLPLVQVNVPRAIIALIPEFRVQATSKVASITLPGDTNTSIFGAVVQILLTGGFNMAGLRPPVSTTTPVTASSSASSTSVTSPASAAAPASTSVATQHSQVTPDQDIRLLMMLLIYARGLSMEKVTQEAIVPHLEKLFKSDPRSLSHDAIVEIFRSQGVTFVGLREMVVKLVMRPYIEYLVPTINESYIIPLFPYAAAMSTSPAFSSALSTAAQAILTTGEQKKSNPIRQGPNIARKVTYTDPWTGGRFNA